MTDQEQIEAIAELRGWKRETRKRYAGLDNVKGWGINQHLECGDPCRDFTRTGSVWPEFLTSLDACKNLIEAMRKEGLEFVLRANETESWECALFVDDERHANFFYDPIPERAICRAFLEHHGKWKD